MAVSSEPSTRRGVTSPTRTRAGDRPDRGAGGGLGSTSWRPRDDARRGRDPGRGTAQPIWQTKIAALRERRLRYEDLQAELERSGQDQLSLTAPDSRSMKGGNGGGTAVCYNVQTAVDAKHKLIVACDVTNDPTDRDWLSPIAVASEGGPRWPVRCRGRCGLLPWAGSEAACKRA